MIVNNLFAGTITKYFNYDSTSTVTNINLNGNIDNIITMANGGWDNTNINTAAGYRLYEVLGVLPTAGTLGRTVFYTPEKTLNFDTGSEWYSAITLLRPPVQGDIVYYNGTNWVVLSAGTANYPLVTNGAGANPAYEVLSTAAGGTGATAAANAANGVVVLDASGYLPNSSVNYTALITAIPKNVQVFTSTGTWTKPSNVSTVYVEVWGAGGGCNSATAGGGGGGYSAGLVTVTGNVTVTVGTGGTAGGAGGNSSFAGSTTPTGNGGAGGAVGAGGAGGTASGGTINLTGQTGSNTAPQGGNSPRGGSGGINSSTQGTTPGGGAGGDTTNASTTGMVIVYY